MMGLPRLSIVLVNNVAVSITRRRGQHLGSSLRKLDDNWIRAGRNGRNSAFRDNVLNLGSENVLGSSAQFLHSRQSINSVRFILEDSFGNVLLLGGHVVQSHHLIDGFEFLRR